jgi:DNA (cytosine-5)-methyltransferase 1
MALKDVCYKELTRALERVGVRKEPKALPNKINRGTFSWAFFLQCVRALDITPVRLGD